MAIGAFLVETGENWQARGAMVWGGVGEHVSDEGLGMQRVCVCV